MSDAIFPSDQVRLQETILVLCVKRNPTGLLNNIRQLHEHKIHTVSLSHAKRLSFDALTANNIFVISK